MLERVVGNLNNFPISISEDFLKNNITILLSNGEKVDFDTYVKKLIIEVLDSALKKEE